MAIYRLDRLTRNDAANLTLFVPADNLLSDQ